MPENAYPVTIHIHWAYGCHCKQEPDSLLCSCFLCRNDYEWVTAMVKSKTRDFFAWTDDEVKLLLKVTHEYKVIMTAENIDWELSQNKYCDIPVLEWYWEFVFFWKRVTWLECEKTRNKLECENPTNWSVKKQGFVWKLFSLSVKKEAVWKKRCEKRSGLCGNCL